jgi:peptidoglycan/LPS O-acetylase OafA/YrhL
MSDPSGAPPPPLPPPLPPSQPPKNRGLGWFFAVSGSVVLLLTLACMISLTDGHLWGEDGELAIICGSPTLILGAVFLWLGSRRLRR